MTEICRRPIVDPVAWTGAAIKGKEGLLRRLSGDEVAALDELVARNRHRPATQITRAEFDHPAVTALMVEARAALLDGHGAIILAHPNLDRSRLDDYERLYWGLGTHLGQGVAQSSQGDKIGRVEKRDDNPTGRGYLGDQELRPHTDFHEIMSLASVEAAAEGGESGLVSSVALHNAMLAARPDLLPALYEGFYHGYNPKAGTIGPKVSPRKVPIFCYVDGQVSCYYHTIFMRFASEILGQPFPPELAEAMAYLNQLAVRPDLQARFMLEPGEMLFWHNWTNFHSRT
ncbi:MAG TPA: TauD/TfdA family dioxygenase, partial [Stellaceae bacterium]|nr:TauD/TfdA family dioxygenase [Stellaceae bacterium]